MNTKVMNYQIQNFDIFLMKFWNIKFDSKLNLSLSYCKFRELLDRWKIYTLKKFWVYYIMHLQRNLELDFSAYDKNEKYPLYPKKRILWIIENPKNQPINQPISEAKLLVFKQLINIPVKMKFYYIFSIFYLFRIFCKRYP
jgi:hypothetical protein